VGSAPIERVATVLVTRTTVGKGVIRLHPWPTHDGWTRSIIGRAGVRGIMCGDRQVIEGLGTRVEGSR